MIRGNPLTFAVLFGFLGPLAPPALGANKVALVIGNTGYPGAEGELGAWDRLPNAVHDVDLISDALTKDGFKVDEVKDGNFDQIYKTIKTFAQHTRDADFAVVYYAGHGFEYERKNYLVPINGPVWVSKNDLSKQFINLEEVANSVAQAKTNVFFLDACRDAVPFVQVNTDANAAQEVGRSIDDIDYPEGAEIAIVYATARGKKAYDAAPPPPDHSPFAKEVADDIALPHADVHFVFGAIRDGVRDKTKNLDPTQTPYVYGSMGLGHYFNDGQEVPEKPTFPLVELFGPAVAQAEGPPALLPIIVPDADWGVTDGPVLMARVLKAHKPEEIKSLAERGDSIAAYFLGYMYEFGTGLPADLAEARRWLEKAAQAKTPQAQLELGYFLERHPTAPTDQEQAKALYKEAAEAGFPKAQAHLAVGLMDGTFAPRTMESYNQGLELLRKAAAQGYPYAMFALALRGSPVDGAQYPTRLRQIAAAGNEDGNQWLCELATQKGDPAGALPDCTIAAQAGSATAQARLAIAYYNGSGVTKSVADADHWARQALFQSDLRSDLRAILLQFKKQSEQR